MMRFRERDRLSNRPSGEPAAEDASGGNLDASREMGDAALRSADAAIERALSADSLQYNRESQQTGGQ